MYLWQRGRRERNGLAQAEPALAGRPGRWPGNWGSLSPRGACFDRPVVRLVAWVVSKPQSNLAGTRQLGVAGVSTRVCTWVVPSVANRAAKEVLPLQLCTLGFGGDFVVRISLLFARPDFSCFSRFPMALRGLPAKLFAGPPKT